MKKLLCALAAALVVGPAAAADVGVSINVNEPGLFGRLDIGGYPPPQTVYAQPVVVQRGPGYVEQDPLYLHVQPGYERNWRRHCAEYDACGRRVFFVRDDWYQRVYAPRYREVHGRGDEHRGPPDRPREEVRGEGDRGHGEGDRDRGRDERGRGEGDRGDGRRNDR